MKSMFLFLPLRVHLLLMVMLLSLPAIILIVYSGLEQRDDSIKEGIAETKMLVQTILSEQNDLTGDAQQLVTVLALLPDVSSHNVSAVNSILANTIKISHKYCNIVITDMTGKVWASALPVTDRQTMKRSRSFENAIKTNRFSSGEYRIDEATKKPTICFAYPITLEGKVKGVIEVYMDFDYLRELLVNSGLPGGCVFTLADRNGTVIYSNFNSNEMVGRKVTPNAFEQMKKGTEKSALDMRDVREGVINSYGNLSLRREQSPYLYLNAGIPVRETLTRAWHSQLLHTAIFTPFLLAALFLAVLIGKYCFVNRIHLLINASKRLAEGESDIRISEIVYGGEMGKLSLSFDQMASQLAERESALLKRETELTELNRSLSKRVEEETERRLKHERLLARQARLAAIGEMIGAIAHQWRQPLATLGAIVQSIRMASDCHCINDEFLERAESAAQKQLAYMSDTIEDFRNFFSPEKVVESFVLKEKLEEVALLAAPQFGISGVSMQIIENAEASGIKIKGYQNEFKQCVLNLISNSFDAVIEKKGSSEEAFAGRVTISVTGEGTAAVVEVGDNGSGIPDEYQDKVFEPYFTSKPEGKGTGIGLYMAKLIIEESMGGRLSFKTGPDGTVFRIEIAREEQEENNNG